MNANACDRAMSHYDVLGVSTRATKEDIKRAYKTLAMKLHPDKRQRKDSETKETKAKANDAFAAAALAHEILSDDARRAEYDAKNEFNGAKKDDVLLNVTFRESIVGGTKLAMVGFKLACSQCEGTGRTSAACAACAGRGDARCGGCDGAGFASAVMCAKCKGEGSMDDYFHGRVHVPPGCEDGTRIPISGRAQHVRVRILPSKQFERDGLNVMSTLRLTAEQAAEGGFFAVETVYGTETTYFDEDSKSGDRKVLPGKGIRDGATAGDHVVRVEVHRARTPEIDDENEDDDENKVEDEDENDDAPRGKKSKPDEPAAVAPSPAELLAAKKAQLLAQLAREIEAKK